jgi:hypothetical protein
VTGTQALDALRLLAEELRDAFVEERRAIATLDHARLEWLATHKQAIAERLREATARVGERDRELARAVLEAVRVEAQATAMLAAAATESVRAALGYNSSGAYDRRARRVTQTPGRTLVAG